MSDSQTPDFAEVAKLADLPPGAATSVAVDGKNIALFNVDGSVYALADSCLHRAMPLSSGEIEGGVVRCRAHGWRYAIATGAVVNAPGLCVASYPTKIVEDRILVSVA